MNSLPHVQWGDFFKKSITAFIFLQANLKQRQQTDLHLLEPSVVHRKFRLSWANVWNQDKWGRRLSSLKKHSLLMGRCHVSWFSFFILKTSFIHIFVFLEVFPLSHPYLDTLLSWWIFIQFEGGSQKEAPLQEWYHVPAGSPCFPISWIHATLAFGWKAPSLTHHLLWLSVHASLEWIICRQFIIETSLFISWSPLVDFLPCYVMAFCSHLASFPQSN